MWFGEERKGVGRGCVFLFMSLLGLVVWGVVCLIRS